MDGMTEILSQFVGMGCVPVVVAFTALVKRWGILGDKFLPVISVAWGIVLNMLIVWALPALEITYPVAIVVGLIAGITATGLYTYGKDHDSTAMPTVTTATETGPTGITTTTTSTPPSSLVE
uniref:Putative holin n=1 Tax=viral metagenome TaxID=1070528 RepID=A0A6M3KXV6_9ZZZZ